MKGFNKHNLSRDIPAQIRLEVRRRSKFACVLCRCGFYQYEHIVPFKDVDRHEVDNICCLCASCHDAVTRGRLSKEAVKLAYERVSQMSDAETPPPNGPIDFHDGNAEIVIGGLLYSPVVQTLVRYHGEDVMRVVPGKRNGEPGRISAYFADENGSVVLRLKENEWIGSLENWDIETIGSRLKIRREKEGISLQLRLEPPGRIVIERLDMRVGNGHLLATEETYAIGRYVNEHLVHWVYANIAVRASSSLGAVIEFVHPDQLEARDGLFRGTCAELSTSNRAIVMNANAGILIKPLGIAIASLTGTFDVHEVATGQRELKDMRRIVKNHPNKVGQFIGTGNI